MSPSHDTPKRWLSIVGIGEEGRAGLSVAAQRLIDEASLVVGGARHLALIGEVKGEKREWLSPFRKTLSVIMERRGQPVCVLASGDPFWFGAGAVLAEHIPPDEMLVIPAASTFSLAAARLGWALQNVACLGLHTAPIESLRRSLHGGQRILALCVDGSTPGKIASFLRQNGFGSSRMMVMEALGGPREAIHSATPHEIEKHPAFDRLCLVGLEIVAEQQAQPLPYAAGLADDLFEHDGQITKREIRAITLSALQPAPGQLLWDVGLGSGSVAIEWLLAHSATKAIGFERKAERAARAARNAAAFGVPHLDIRQGSAPEVFADTPAPDAVFIGGGVSHAGVLEACWAALKPGGRLVANAVTFKGQARLMAAREALGGEILRISIEREELVGAHSGWRPAMPVLQWMGIKPWS